MCDRHLYKPFSCMNSFNSVKLVLENFIESPVQISLFVKQLRVHSNKGSVISSIISPLKAMPTLEISNGPADLIGYHSICGHSSAISYQLVANSSGYYFHPQCTTPQASSTFPAYSHFH